MSHVIIIIIIYPYILLTERARNANFITVYHLGSMSVAKCVAHAHLQSKKFVHKNTLFFASYYY